MRCWRGRGRLPNDDDRWMRRRESSFKSGSYMGAAKRGTCLIVIEAGRNEGKLCAHGEKSFLIELWFSLFLVKYGPSNHCTTALRCPWLTGTFLASAVTFVYLARCRNRANTSSYLILCWCWIYHLPSNWSSKDSKCSQSNYRVSEESCMFSMN